MRVTQKAIFDANSYRLGKLVESLNNANEVVSTGKRINRISDDPVGIGRVLNLRSSLANLDQLNRNISTGRTWLDAAETAMSSVESLLVDTKVLAIAMKNESVNAADRANAAVQVKETLMEIFGIANTRVNGQYLFSGMKTDTMPYNFDNPNTPTLASYNGDTTGFSIKTGKDTTMAVGFPGEDVFCETTVVIDETNNKINFKENAGIGLGTELTATIALGTYDATSFAQAVEVAMESASASAPAPANSIDYDVSYNITDRKFAIAEDTSLAPATLTELQFLWQTGANAATNPAAELGFDAAIDITVDSTLGIPYESDTVQWGVFKTLFDLRDALEHNDFNGIAKSLSKLDQHAEHMSNTTSQVGYKGVALDVKENMIADLSLSNKAEKSKIEEADIIEAISELNSKELTYQAALAASSKVMKLSLLDYL
jgi:flagellar hook-associated protein 3